MEVKVATHLCAYSSGKASILRNEVVSCRAGWPFPVKVSSWQERRLAWLYEIKDPERRNQQRRRLAKLYDHLLDFLTVSTSEVQMQAELTGAAGEHLLDLLTVREIEGWRTPRTLQLRNAIIARPCVTAGYVERAP
jgi:hypothetical protein